MFNNVIEKLCSVINPKREDRWKSKIEFVIKSLDPIIWEYDLKKDSFFPIVPTLLLVVVKNLRSILPFTTRTIRLCYAERSMS